MCALQNRILLLVTQALLGAAAPALAGPHFYGGLSYHVMPRSEWTDFWEDYGVHLAADHPGLSGMAGFLLPGAVDSTQSAMPRRYKEISVSFYGSGDRAVFNGFLAEARYRVYSVESIYHLALSGLQKPITFYAGIGLAWVDDRRQVGFVVVEDGNLSSTVCVGMRVMALQGLWTKGYLDLRYRFHRMRYEGDGANYDFDLGGFFAGSGFMF